jgi:hypothetical protein
MRGCEPVKQEEKTPQVENTPRKYNVSISMVRSLIERQDFLESLPPDLKLQALNANNKSCNCSGKIRQFAIDAVKQIKDYLAKP